MANPNRAARNARPVPTVEFSPSSRAVFTKRGRSSEWMVDVETTDPSTGWVTEVSVGSVSKTDEGFEFTPSRDGRRAGWAPSTAPSLEEAARTASSEV